MSASPNTLAPQDNAVQQVLPGNEGFAPFSEKTSGEKKFSALRFGVAELFILGVTAVIAYVARDGKEEYFGVRNHLKRFSEGFHNLLLNNRFLPLGEKGETGARLAGAAASTMLTFHGGNLFAPVMLWFNNSKAKIVDHFNRTSGKSGELEAGRERLKDEPKEGWGSVIKGRLAAWAIVFTSFVSADFLLGKEKIATGANGVRQYRFDKYENWFGEKFSAMCGKLFGTETGIGSTSHKFGKILALDIFATTAAILIWTTASKLLAGKKKAPAAQSQNMRAVRADQPLPFEKENVPDSVGAGEGKHTARLGMSREPELSMGLS